MASLLEKFKGLPAEELDWRPRYDRLVQALQNVLAEFCLKEGGFQTIYLKSALLQALDELVIIGAQASPIEP